MICFCKASSLIILIFPFFFQLQFFIFKIKQLIGILCLQESLKALLCHPSPSGNYNNVQQWGIFFTAQDSIYGTSWNVKQPGHFRHTETGCLCSCIFLTIFLCTVSGLAVIPVPEGIRRHSHSFIHGNCLNIVFLQYLIYRCVVRPQHFLYFFWGIRSEPQLFSRCFPIDFVIPVLIGIPLFKTGNFNPHLSKQCFCPKIVFMNQPVTTCLL